MMNQKSNNVTVNNATAKAKAKVEAKLSAKTEVKKSYDIDSINAKAEAKAEAKKSAKSSAKSSDKKTAKQSVKSSDTKLSAYKTACRNVASLADNASAEDKKLAFKLASAVETEDFNVVFKDTTACALFIVDDNKNTVCNVYDCMRIQFTTVQARKYKDALLADSRFYTHIYKNNEFISCKCSTFDEFVSAMQYVNKVYKEAKQTAKATATEVTASAKAEAK